MPRTPQILHVEFGSLRLEWCDRCLLSHAFADALALTPSGVGPVGVWADHNEQDGD